MVVMNRSQLRKTTKKMTSKSMFLLLAVLATSCYAGIVPVAPAAYVANYATAYNAHVINHAIAAPVAAAPLVAAHAPLAYAPYSAYSAYPYAAAYQSPLVVAK